MRLPYPACGSLLVSLLAAFVAEGQTPRPWNEYQAIMWVGDSASKAPDKLPLFYQRLREMGISAAMVTGDEDARHLLDAKMPYYVENMVNRGLCLKWNSKVRDWPWDIGWSSGPQAHSIPALGRALIFMRIFGRMAGILTERGLQSASKGAWASSPASQCEEKSRRQSRFLSPFIDTAVSAVLSVSAVGLVAIREVS